MNGPGRLTLLLLVALSACGPGLPTNGYCPDAGTGLTWANFGSRFMTSYCVGCHGGTRVEKKVDLTSEAGVALNADPVIAQAGIGTQMPPTGSPAPTPSERKQLAEWAGCGAP